MRVERFRAILSRDVANIPKQRLLQHEAAKDIPPALRGEIWMALLGISDSNNRDVSSPRIRHQISDETRSQIRIDVRCGAVASRFAVCTQQDLTETYV
jgi:hypothetical protein